MVVRTGDSPVWREVVSAPLSVEFHFDFGSPNSYLAHLVLPAIERRTGVSFKYVPVLLGGIYKLTGNRSPGEALAGIKNKLEYRQLETRRFIARHGLTAYRPNPHFPVNTLALMRGAVAAEEMGVFKHYVEEAYRHMWMEPKKMDDPLVMHQALLESGLDVDRLEALCVESHIRERLRANTERSVERGAFGSPTFLVEDQLFFGKDRLGELEETIQEKLAGQKVRQAAR